MYSNWFDVTNRLNRSKNILTRLVNIKKFQDEFEKKKVGIDYKKNF